MVKYDISDYLQIAKANETVFRNILKDLKENAQKRPHGMYISFQTGATCSTDIYLPIEEIVKKFSKKGEFQTFSIANFTRDKTRAVISYNGCSSNEEVSAALEYIINEDESVRYSCAIMVGVTTFLNPMLRKARCWFPNE